jgi:hypothetical protein
MGGINTFPEPMYSKDFGPQNKFNLPPGTYKAIITLAQKVITDEGLQVPGVGSFVQLTNGASVNSNLNDGTDYILVLDANATIAAPTAPPPTKIVRYHVQQDSTGGYTLSWNSEFKFSTSIPTPTQSTAAYAMDIYEFLYSFTNNAPHYHCIRVVQGFDNTPLP